MDRLRRAFETPFTGWDFSSVDWVESDAPWDFQGLVEQQMHGRMTLLDMNTGGGEFLTSLTGLPPNVYATESYEPNIPLARERLEAQGYHLQAVTDPTDIPFDEAFFDIIINRHGAFDPVEVERRLATHGIFLTQQVGGLNAADLNQTLGAPLMDNSNWCLTVAVQQIRQTGMIILRAALNTGTYRFPSIESVVSYLKAIPWQIPSFTPDKYADRLAILDEQISRDGHLDILSQRFLILATKPGPIDQMAAKVAS